MKRSDGAKAWSTVLSELAQVKVSVEWERPTWRVSWQDGPTREALMGRAGALGEYRVGAPAAVRRFAFRPQQLRCGDRVGLVGAGESGVVCSGPGGGRRSGGVLCGHWFYPQTRFDAATLAAAELMRRVGHGDIAEMGALLAQAVPPVAPAVMLATGPELTGRVVSYRWPAGGPPEGLLGPSGWHLARTSPVQELVSGAASP